MRNTAVSTNRKWQISKGYAGGSVGDLDGDSAAAGYVIPIWRSGADNLPAAMNHWPAAQ
jgi:hypothetical protein